LVSSDVVLVCEHASNHVPAELFGLGASDETLASHAAWDPGAIEVAEAMALELDATLVAAQVSRLVYDCNRPPEASSAMIAKSEAHRIPGNENLDAQARSRRALTWCTSPFTLPFRIR
jgi:predicted N-formylglutamate amidohydrolase